MKDLTVANKAKSESVLNGLIRYEGKTMSKKEFILELLNEGFYPVSEKQNNMHKFNRTKFNRLTNSEQEAYEKRLAKVETKYLLRKGNLSFELSKTEMDFAAENHDLKAAKHWKEYFESNPRLDLESFFEALWNVESPEAEDLWVKYEAGLFENENQILLDLHTKYEVCEITLKEAQTEYFEKLQQSLTYGN